MQFCSLVTLCALCLPAGAFARPSCACGRFGARDSVAVVAIHAVADGSLTGDQVGGRANGLLGDEENSEDGDLFDFGFSEVLPDLIAPTMIAPAIGRRGGLDGRAPTRSPLRC